MKFDHIIYALAALGFVWAIATIAPARPAAPETLLTTTIVACDALAPAPACDLAPPGGDLLAAREAVVS